MRFSDCRKRVVSGILALALAVPLSELALVGHPVRAEAATVKTGAADASSAGVTASSIKGASGTDGDSVLERDMTHFVRIGDYNIIQTSGEALEAMFGFSFGQKQRSRQYIAFYDIDTKASTSHTWHTHTLHWTNKPVSNYCVDDSHLKQAGHILSYNVCDSSGCGVTKKETDGGYKTDQGKKGFSTYYTSVKKITDKRGDVSYEPSGTKHSVPAGMVGTMKYFCSDYGQYDTNAGNTRKSKILTVENLLKYKDTKTGTVTFYISPTIACRTDRRSFTKCYDWFHHAPWADKNYGHYTAHYNKKVVFRTKSVSVNVSSYMAGGAREKGDKRRDKAQYYQKDPGKSIKNAKTIGDEDGLRKAKSDKNGNAIKIDDGGVTIKIRRGEEKAKKLTSPYASFGDTLYIKPKTNVHGTYNGKACDFFPVGMTISKNAEFKDSDGTNHKGNFVYLMNMMLDLKYDKDTKAYTIAYGEDKNQADTRTDTADVTTIADKYVADDEESSGSANDEDSNGSSQQTGNKPKTVKEDISGVEHSKQNRYMIKTWHTYTVRKGQQQVADNNGTKKEQKQCPWVEEKNEHNDKNIQDKIPGVTKDEWFKYLCNTTVDNNGIKNKDGWEIELDEDYGIKSEDGIDLATDLNIEVYYVPIEGAGTDPVVYLQQYLATSEDDCVEDLTYGPADHYGRDLADGSKEPRPDSPDIANSKKTPSDAHGSFSTAHKSKTNMTFKAGTKKPLAKLNYGDPWVSYDVELAGDKKANDHPSYKLDGGKTAPDKSDDKVSSGGGGKTVDKSKPKITFKKSQLQNKEVKGIKGKANPVGSKSYIPYVMTSSKDTSEYSQTADQYLYKIVIEAKNSDGSKWMTLTADDIWNSRIFNESEAEPGAGKKLDLKFDSKNRLKPKNGKITGWRTKGSKRTEDISFTTNAPFARSDLYVTNNTPHQMKVSHLFGNSSNKTLPSEWCFDAYNMTHFIIPEVRGDITIKAYYSHTLPLRTLVYKWDGSEYKLQKNNIKLTWLSAGTKYTQTFNAGNDVRGIIAAKGKMASMIPYSEATHQAPSFKSIDAAKKYYSTSMSIRMNATCTAYDVKMPSQPAVVCIFVGGEDPQSYFTKVSYVHTQDGTYHFIKKERIPINDYGPYASHWQYRTWSCGKYSCWPVDHYCQEEGDPLGISRRAVAVKALVSFPQYVSFDETGMSDGNGGVAQTGLYGSLYKETGIWAGYNGDREFPKITKSAPYSGESGADSPYHKANNSKFYLTPAGRKSELQGGTERQIDERVRSNKNANQLVCYCIYEDIYKGWTNESDNPHNTVDSNDALTIEEQKLVWNWTLPYGFVWNKVDIESQDTPKETKFENEWSRPFVASVLATGESAAYDPQQGIPTTDYVRTVAGVPRYLTKGFWNRNNLYYRYKVYAAYVRQHKTTQTIVTGRNDWHMHDSHHKYEVPVTQSFDVYTSEEVSTERVDCEVVDVTRESVYYKLGDAEVWDPEKVTYKNDVFSDNIITKNDTVTMYGAGVQGQTYRSGAYFTCDCAGGYEMPSKNVARQYVNYGTYNDWELNSSEWHSRVDEDVANLQADAESIINKFKVQSDKVIFYDGDPAKYGHGGGKRYELSVNGLTSTQTQNFKDIDEDAESNATKIPAFPPEAEMLSYCYENSGNTYAFDSANNVHEGIMVKTEKWNGYHDSVPIAYYRQVQCLAPNPEDYKKYKVSDSDDDLLKTKILDDGDDDIIVYTPTVCDSKLNLDYTNKEAGADGLPLSPADDYDQAVAHSEEQTRSNIQLDREYTMTLSVVGNASDLQGYGEQDYVRYLERDKNGIPYTQVKFPFPVRMVVRMKQNNNTIVKEDRYYYKDTWINIEMIDETGKVTGKIDQTFFVPSWATELEKVTIDFRSPAINRKANDPDWERHNEYTNDDYVKDELVNPEHDEERDYVATAQEKDTVTGRISSFQVIDVTDYPAWEPVFRKYSSEKGEYTTEHTGNAYHSGICNEFSFADRWGSLYTTPIVGTSNPASQSQGTLGFGYKIRYKMTTVGPYYNQTDRVTFVPEFYYMNDKGEYLHNDGKWSRETNNRLNVSVYYNETFSGRQQSLVKVGSDNDLVNRKALRITDDAWSMPKERIDFTNNVLHSNNVGEKENQYTFYETKMTTAMRTINGDRHMSAHRGRKNDKASDREFDFNSKMYGVLTAIQENPDAYAGTDYATLVDKLTPEEVARSVQTWYGEYYLPSQTYITAEPDSVVMSKIADGFDGTEDCWLSGGRLVVNFNPVLSSDTKQTLKYNVEHVEEYTDIDGSIKYYRWGCNQFAHENYVISKTLADGHLVPFNSGDVVIYDKLPDGTPGDPNDPDSPPKTHVPGYAPAAGDAYDSSGSH